MSVRFNSPGTQVLALPRLLLPMLYPTGSPEQIYQFYHQDYYNSCTMKICCFAGENDQFVLSGSDDFNMYQNQIVLYGHRSIVNQVPYNPQKCLIVSSDVEKIVKLLTPFELNTW